jgi:hypothetical protein
LYLGKHREREGVENMHGIEKTQEVEKNKKLSIWFLTAFSIAIILMGSCFSVYSVLYGIQFTVLNNPVHGVVFGLLVIYLGFRYFFAVRKLRVEVYKPTSSFSFQNFKK